MSYTSHISRPDVASIGDLGKELMELANCHEHAMVDEYEEEARMCRLDMVDVLEELAKYLRRGSDEF